MPDIISLEEARLSLRLGSSLDTDEQADLAFAVEQAEGIYLEYYPMADWGDTSPIVATDSQKAAVILLLHAIWDNRGDDPLTKAHNLMRLNRGPALA